MDRVQKMLRPNQSDVGPERNRIYSVFQKSDAKIEITITATNVLRMKYPLSSFNYHLSGANVANFNKIHCTVFELFKKWNAKTEVSNMENSP